MAVDWAEDIKKYAPKADDAVIKKIVTHCGIALQNADSSQVSFGDPEELKRVKEGFCTKKLGLTADEADKAIAAVGAKLDDASRKYRPTVYYLIAEAAGKLSLFN